MNRRCNSMKRINKGTRLVYHFFVLFILILLVDSESTPMSSPFKCGAVNARGSRHKTKPQSINARAVKICRPPHNIYVKVWGMEMQSMSMQSPSWCGTGRNTAHIPYAYEPPLGENRDLGEILDSTLTQNPRLI